MDVNKAKFQMFDKVKVKKTILTISKGFSNKIGSVSGVTTPSVSKPTVIGKLKRDLAINVTFEKEQIWFAEELLEYIGPDVGATISIGDKHFIISEKGEMVEQNSRPQNGV